MIYEAFLLLLSLFRDFYEPIQLTANVVCVNYNCLDAAFV